MKKNLGELRRKKKTTERAEMWVNATDYTVFHEFYEMYLMIKT